MSRLIALAGCLLAFLTTTAFAVDLGKIERKIERLPEFTTNSQQHCLIVFGPDAHKRVWLVRDGKVLYVDRNSNGDLTEPGEFTK